MTTNIPPSGMSRLTSFRPRLQPVRARIFSLSTPCRTSANPAASLRPNTLVTLRISILAMLGPPGGTGDAAPSAETLRDPIEHNGQNDDADAGFQTLTDVEGLDSVEHPLTQAPRPDHGGNHHHRQGKHDGLVDAGHDARPRQRQLYPQQHLQRRDAEGGGRSEEHTSELQ